MAKYRKKPAIIEATQWFKNGDHPRDDCEYYQTSSNDSELSEGKVVRYFRRPDIMDNWLCPDCGKTMHDHGWIDIPEPEDGYIVCPGDWIITSDKGAYYPCNPGVFEKKYELVK